MPVEPVISKVILRREVRGKLMAPAPSPEVSSAPVSPLRSRQALMAPVESAASRMTTVETGVAEAHLIEAEPVGPAGDQ